MKKFILILFSFSFYPIVSEYLKSKKTNQKKTNSKPDKPELKKIEKPLEKKIFKFKNSPISIYREINLFFE